MNGDKEKNDKLVHQILVLPYRKTEEKYLLSMTALNQIIYSSVDENLEIILEY